jgi:hypothetical protein
MIRGQVSTLQHLVNALIHVPRAQSGEIDLARQEALAAKVEAATRAREDAKARLTETKRLIEEAVSQT